MNIKPSGNLFTAAPVGALALITATARAADALTAADARAIGKEAYTYGIPMMDRYRIMHACFVDRANPEYKAEVESSCNENQ